ncbi:MAG: hypothetical protein JSV30_03355 [Candidatus Omnitrophota bacterium]|nr:MAG: hypothetical protein JSV30_03355 [Candidatus Omnitrophota bacterium]
MFNLFKKNKLECEKCFSPLEKRKYHFFDPTYRGLFKNNQKKLRLCTPCLMDKYKEYLEAFEYKAVIIEPFKPLNAYQFYTFEDMPKYNWKKELVERIKSLIPEIGKCKKCGSSAHFLLYSPEVYSKDPWNFILVPEYKGIYLCPDCVTDHLKQIIEKEQIFFDEVFPPIRGDGVATSFEA